jgi:hypothetical protein
MNIADVKQKYIILIECLAIFFYEILTQIFDFQSNMYNETCLNRTSLGPTFVFGMDRCLVYTGWMNKDFLYCTFILRRVWRYQRGNQNPYIENEQTTQWPKEKVQKDKERFTKHTHKTKDRVTQTPRKLFLYRFSVYAVFGWNRFHYNKIKTVKWSAKTLKYLLNNYTGSTELCQWQICVLSILVFCLISERETIYYVFQTSLLPSALKLH